MIHTKNPKTRELFHGFEENIALRVLEILTSESKIFENSVRNAKEKGLINTETDISYESAKQFYDQREFKINVPTERHLEREMEALDIVLPYLFERNWILFKASKEDAGFVTSDHPVVLQWRDPKLKRSIYPPGHGSRHSEILFPISNKLAVIGIFDQEEKVIEASSNFVARFNAAVIAASKQQVYAKDDNFLYAFGNMDEPERGSTLIEYVRKALKNKKISNN